MLKLFLQELRFRRGAIIGWGLGLCFFPIVYVGLYPSFADQLANFQEMMDMAIYQAMGISMASFEGYVASTVTNLVPVILAIYAVINGTGTLAGEEDDGRLETIVALPIPRWQIVTVKALALSLALLVILAIVAAGAALTLASISSQVETAVTPLRHVRRCDGCGPAGDCLCHDQPLPWRVQPQPAHGGHASDSRGPGQLPGQQPGRHDHLTGTHAGSLPLPLFRGHGRSAGAGPAGRQPGRYWSQSPWPRSAWHCFFFQRRDITVGAWPWQRGRVPA